MAAAGWLQSAKWKRQANELQADQQGTGAAATISPVTSSSGLALPTSTSSGPNADSPSPTVSMMEEVDLMRQVDLLTSENQRLNEDLKRLREKSTEDEKAQRDRAAIDGTGGGSILR